MTNAREGGCQCGAVRYRLKGEPVAVAVCHCTDCQQQTGGAFGMSMLVPKSSLEILSGDLTTFTKTASSGKEVKCMFCPACGNRIYHETVGAADGIVRVKPGTLDDTSWLAPDIHVWTKSKQQWVSIPDGVACVEKQP